MSASILTPELNPYSVNNNLINQSNSHWAAPSMSNNGHNPSSLNNQVMPQVMNNQQAAAGIIPCYHSGGRKNKISRKYKMGSKSYKKSCKKIGSKCSKICSKICKCGKICKCSKICKCPVCKRNRSTRKRKATMKKRGAMKKRGGGMAPFIPGQMPQYPAGYSQYQNNLPQDTSYSLGGKLAPSMSALANPLPISKVSNNAIDNLNHYATNSYGKGDTGMGFPSRGWF
tara:strand:+ start:228 stop:911 length:684 start_codon:yes stop_codon:yes gene_type:complete